jgi:hypothetical protein
MGLLQYAKAGNLNNFKNKIKELSLKENKSSLSLFIKFLYCFIKTGGGYSDFLNYKLYKRNSKELNEYVTIKHQDWFYEIVSPSAYKKFFTIKPDFLRNFSKYIGRDFFTDGSVEELEIFLKNNPEFMIKPYDGLGGQGVAKMTREQAGTAEEFYKKLKDEHLFVEGYVKQNSQINKLCSASVNTIRVMTFSYGGKSRILYAAMRIGNGINHCDNFHQGGMGCSLDIETGKLVGNAIDKDLNVFENHPVSGIKFDGFQIPNWEKAKEIVLEAALVNDKIHVVGWDVAITEEGATFIEGNRRPGFDLVQVLSERGRKDIMRSCLEEINKNEGTNYKI